MTYHSSIMAVVPNEPTRIAVLRCRDDFNMDPAPLVALFQGHSDKDAENLVCRALEDIASRLDRLQAARQAGAFDEIPGPARRIAKIADGLGLTEVAMVAGHIATASQMNCAVATGATMARMERCFDTAVSHVWDFRRFC